MSPLVLALFLGQPPAGPPEVRRLPQEGIRIAVAFAPDGKTLATGGDDNQVRLWDVATGQLRRAVPAHSAPAGISRLAFFPDGRMFASASWSGDGTVKLWEVATGKQRQLLATHDGGIAVLAVSPAGRLLAWNGNGKVHVHDAWANRQVHTLTMRAAVDSVAFSPNGKLLATAEGAGLVVLWDMATGKEVSAVRAGQTTATGSQAVAFSRDGKTLVTASRKVKLWDVATGKEVAELGGAAKNPVGESPFCVATSPDGQYLAAGSNCALRLWDWGTRKELHCWPGSVASVAFSPDGRWLAFGSRESGGSVGLVAIGNPAR